MSLKTFFAFCPLMLISIFWTVKSIPECPTCGTVMCPPQPEDCTYGVEMDICGCCFVCNKKPGEKCFLVKKNNIDKDWICKWIKKSPITSPHRENNNMMSENSFIHRNNKPHYLYVTSQNGENRNMKTFRYQISSPEFVMNDARKVNKYALNLNYLQHKNKPSFVPEDSNIQYVKGKELEDIVLRSLTAIFDFHNKMQINFIKYFYLKHINGERLKAVETDSPWIFIYKNPNYSQLKNVSLDRKRRHIEESAGSKSSGIENEKLNTSQNESQTVEASVEHKQEEISSRFNLDSVLDGVGGVVSTVLDGALDFLL